MWKSFLGSVQTWHTFVVYRRSSYKDIFQLYILRCRGICKQHEKYSRLFHRSSFLDLSCLPFYRDDWHHNRHCICNWLVHMSCWYKLRSLRSDRDSCSRLGNKYYACFSSVFILFPINKLKFKLWKAYVESIFNICWKFPFIFFVFVVTKMWSLVSILW